MPFSFIVADASPDRRAALIRALHTAFPESETLEALTGPNALARVFRLKPDVIIADAELPELDGFQVCERIKSEPDTVTTMVMLVTPAHAESRHRAHGLDCGADSCLSRPLDEEELLAQLRALLRIRAAEMKLLDHERKLQDELQTRLRVEAELKKMTESAQALGEAKSQFLAQMSHEIRTPMNAVVGITEVLLDTPLSPEQRDMVDTIRSGGETLLTVLNDILDFSKIESGNLSIESRPLKLRELVDQTVNLFRKNAEKKGLRLELEYRLGMPETLLGDAVRFRQILSNLLNNAIKFTEQGSIHVHVGGMYRGGKQFELHVRVNDTGAGIPHERMDRLFKPFSQGDASTSRRYGGTGLGLIISQRLVELMDGRLWVHSVPGTGSEFHFTILMGLLKRSPHVLDALPGKARILLVAADETPPTMAVPHIAPCDMEVDQAATMSEAAERMAHTAYAAILLHAVAPGADLREQVQRMLRPSGVENQPPILLLTPHAKDHPEWLSAPAPWIAVLPDTCSESDLLDSLSAALQEHSPVPAAPESLAWPSAPAGMRLLVAEDNEINRRVMDLLLRRLGWNPVFANDGLQAVEAAQAAPYDFILMDVQMPGLDGVEER